MGRAFTFDKVFDQACSQSDVFDEVALPLVDSVLDGFNATVFAYGQTGSGKTFTMQGATTGDSRGLMMRSVERLFSGMRERADGASYSCTLSFLQLYNEVPTDCLAPKGAGGGGATAAPLRMREDGARVVVEGLRQEPLSSPADAARLIAIGAAMRCVGGTTQNSESSRSHAVLTLRVTAQLACDDDGVRHERVTSLHLVDLAGSERQKSTCATGARLREACCINKSLSALGNVISALAASSARHVPYRDSKLTLLLRDAVGGDAVRPRPTRHAQTEAHAREAHTRAAHAREAQKSGLRERHERDARRRAP